MTVTPEREHELLASFEDTIACPKSARSTTMPSSADARSRCIIFRSAMARAYTY